MTTHLLPKVPHDLALAPVAVTIDRNLRFLRDRTEDEMLGAIELELDQPETKGTPGERADRILRVALRNVDAHGWKAEVTPDHSRLSLSGGSVTIDLGLSASILRFIEANDQEGPADQSL